MILAYLDPGAGSLLVQALLAGALAIPFLLRSQLRTLADRILHRGSVDPDTTRTDPSSD